MISFQTKKHVDVVNQQNESNWTWFIIRFATFPMCGWYRYDICHICEDLKTLNNAMMPMMPRPPWNMQFQAPNLEKRWNMQVIYQNTCHMAIEAFNRLVLENYPIQNRGSQAIHVRFPQGRGKITPSPHVALVVGTCRHRLVSSQNRSWRFEGRGQWWPAMWKKLVYRPILI